jgi:hypothetical protein
MLSVYHITSICQSGTAGVTFWYCGGDILVLRG